MMRNWSNLSLTVLSGLTLAVLLLGAIRARTEGPAEKGGRVIAVSKPSKADSALDFGVADLRGALP
jgi:hypothetical protein